MDDPAASPDASSSAWRRHSLSLPSGAKVFGWMAVPPHDDGRRPFALSVLAGGCASATVDVAIHPLDTLKTRLQAPQGFVASGGYRGLFRGVLPAALGAVPGGAVFFGTYEYTKARVRPAGEGAAHWSFDAVAATTAAMASCLFRNPAAVVTQRLQVGQFDTLLAAVRSIAEGGPAAFYRGLTASLARELPFAFIQFPLYESLKRLLAPISGLPFGDITPAQGALCGSLSGAVAAAATTPFDTLKTRQMLGMELGLFALTRDIVRKEGWVVLFSGMGPRVGWMTVGGCIFFGVYEQCMLALTQLHRAAQQERMHSDEPAAHATRLLKQRDSGDRSSRPADAPASLAAPETAPPAAGASEPVRAGVALLSGGMAGMMIDCILFPVDTLKTRAIHGVRFSWQDTWSLWNGLGAALLPAVPAAGVFFFTYEGIKGQAEQLMPRGSEAATPFVAAAVAEAVSCVVRVPAELVKMRLQVNRDASIGAALRSTWVHGGVGGLYKGLAATLLLDLPFAMIQLPLFEALKAWPPLRRSHSEVTAVDGALAGGLAGAIAAFVTTPMDVVRTRHVLRPQAAGESSSFLHTARLIYQMSGVRGFCTGVVPRTGYMFLGGVVYLGTYNYCCSTISKLAPFRC